jgi:hypothetical protein
MPRTLLIALLLWVGFAVISRADDKLQLPKGTPPRLVSVVKVDGDVLSYRDYLMPLIPKQSDRLNAGELVPSHPAIVAMFAGVVDFSFKEGTVLDGEGKKINAVEARKRLKVTDTVLVSTSGTAVDPTYLRILKKDALILVHPLPPPGPPLPGGDK